jgi:hypothetical protein
MGNVLYGFRSREYLLEIENKKGGVQYVSYSDIFDK